MKYILFISWNVPRYQVNLCDSNSSGFVRSRDNTPAPLLNMDKEHEEQMINNFRSEMESKMKEKAREEKAEEKQVEEEAKKEQEEATEMNIPFETVATEPTPGAKENIVNSGDIKVEVHATAVHHDQVLEPKMAHAMSHEISHSQAVSEQTTMPSIEREKRYTEHWCNK